MYNIIYYRRRRRRPYYILYYCSDYFYTRFFFFRRLLRPSYGIDVCDTTSETDGPRGDEKDTPIGAGLCHARVPTRSGRRLFDVLLLLFYYFHIYYILYWLHAAMSDFRFFRAVRFCTVRFFLRVLHLITSTRT